MSFFVIGLTGRAGAGKSTAAEYLVADRRAARLPFAAPLKRMLRLFLEDQGVGLAMAHRMTDGDLKEASSDLLGGRTPRSAMQTLGTEWGRGLSSTLWINAWRRAVEDRKWKAEAFGETVLIVADDVRFPDEIEAIRALSGLVVRVDRPGPVLTGEAGAHTSEAGGLGDPDVTIHNDGSLDQLRAQVGAIAASVMD